jgi:hypothetical protein
VSGIVPPVAVICSEYGVPTVAPGSGVEFVIEGAALTTMLIDWSTWAAAESVRRTVGVYVPAKPFTVPEIMPALEIVTPVGMAADPGARAQVYGDVPPLAELATDCE